MLEETFLCTACSALRYLDKVHVLVFWEQNSLSTHAWTIFEGLSFS